ncbi:MAG TPA: SPOR domain-containing protein [Syntrophales bacterium]|nr:SPOR domain-containing protein [Syntrophales bacterium]
MRPQRMKEFEFRLGKLGLTLFIIGISFLLFLSFVMGVMIGVNMEGNPDQISQGIPGIIKQKIGRAAPGETGGAEKGAGEEAKKAGTAEKGEFKLTFFDTLSKGKVSGSADATPQKAKKEETRREETPTDAARTTVAAAGKFVIQVASLQDRKKAEDLRDRLNSMGYAPYIDSAELSDRGRWYRVKLKGFETKEEAQKVVDGLQAKVKGLQCMILPAGS